MLTPAELTAIAAYLQHAQVDILQVLKVRSQSIDPALRHRLQASASEAADLRQRVLLLAGQ